MQYYNPKTKTEFLSLLKMAELNGWKIDSGQRSAVEYADAHWPRIKSVGIDYKNCFGGHYIDRGEYPNDQPITFEQMAAILLKTAQPPISLKDFADYVIGFLEAENAKSNDLSLNNMKAALSNALGTINCANDGIAAYVERRAAQS